MRRAEEEPSLCTYYHKYNAYGSCSLGHPKGKCLDNAHLYQIPRIWMPAIQWVKGDIMTRGGLLRIECHRHSVSFINSILLYKFILILQKRKLRIRRLKGGTRSCTSERVGCNWHPVCLTANPVLIPLHYSHCLLVSQPQRGDCWDRGTRQTSSAWRNRFME